MLRDFAKHTIKFFRDRIEHARDSTKKLISRNGNCFDSAISDKDPTHTRILIYEKGKSRSIGSANIIYPKHQFMLPRHKRDNPIVNFQFKNFQKHSKHAHEVGQLCINHIYKEGYKGATFNLETDYTKLPERMSIKDYKFSFDRNSKKPFRYEIPLYNSLNNQYPELGAKINSWLKRHPESIRELENFLDRNNRQGKEKESNVVQLSPKQQIVNQSSTVAVAKLKKTLANEIAKSPEFAKLILHEVKKSQMQHQQLLLEQAKEILKMPGNRKYLEKLVQKHSESHKQAPEIKPDQILFNNKQQKPSLKQEETRQQNGIRP